MTSVACTPLGVMATLSLALAFASLGQSGPPYPWQNHTLPVSGYPRAIRLCNCCWHHTIEHTSSVDIIQSVDTMHCVFTTILSIDYFYKHLG